MVLKLYSPTHANAGCGIVAMVLAEKQIPFELIVVNTAKKEHKAPEYLVIQPFGQVPMIDDNGFLLYESRAICRYLAEKYAGQGIALLPTTLEGKALFEQAASIEFATFFPKILNVSMEGLYKKRIGQPVDEAVLAQAVSEISEKLDVYEVILGKQKFLAGNEFTLADLFHLYFAPMVVDAGIDIMAGKGPNVTRWWNELISRPTWIKLKQEGIKSVGV
ncbi:glutathione S-transferase [Mycena vulgaris]|nr:glutathione S-transferase [Mycena vulgaris]